LKELLELGINYHTELFNAILKIDYFPSQWKMAQIIMILEPNKDLVDLRLYRSISYQFIHHIKNIRKITFPETVMAEKRLIPNH